MLAVTFAVLVALSGVGHAETNHINIAWDATTHDTEGNVITDPVTYRVTWNTDTQPVTTQVVATAELQATVPYVPVVTNYYNVYALLTSKFESADNTQTWEVVSEAAWGRFQAPAPAEAPSGLRRVP
jgi:hypothetical protein